MPYFLKHLIYLWLRMIMRWAVGIFHRGVEVTGKEHIKRRWPYIFAMNHQNALTDPLATLSVVPNFIYFLTRADIFSGKLLLEVFDTLKMFPIYRQRDGVDTLKRNEEIFERCFKVLGRKHSVGIYPEGSHDRHYRVRPLKKGVVRLAFQAEEQYDFTLGVEILPVGLNYFDHTRFRGRLLINFGRSIPMTNYLALYKEDPNKALIVLKKDVREAMIDTTLHIRNMQQYDLIEGLREIHLNSFAHSGTNHSLHEQFLESKTFIRDLETWLEEKPERIETLQSQLQQYHKALSTQQFSDIDIARPTKRLGTFAINGILLLLFAPIFLFGALFNFPIYYLAGWLARSQFKDDHFHSSIKLVVGYLGFPLWYLILGLISSLFMPWWGIMSFLASLPLTGIFAINIKEWFQELRMAWKKRGLSKEVRDGLLSQRANLQTFMLGEGEVKGKQLSQEI